MDFLRKINLFDDEHAESMIGVSNSLDPQREIAELILKVYLSMDIKIGTFLGKSSFSMMNMQKV